MKAQKICRDRGGGGFAMHQIVLQNFVSWAQTLPSKLVMVSSIENHPLEHLAFYVCLKFNSASSCCPVVAPRKQTCNSASSSALPLKEGR